MFCGMEKIARTAAGIGENSKGIMQFIPLQRIRVEPGFASYSEPMLPLSFHVLIRFGRWSEIIDRANVIDSYSVEDKHIFCTFTATAYYARGLAYAAMDRVDEAEKELKMFISVCEFEEMKSRILHNNTMLAIFEVNRKMLQGEIAFRRGELGIRSTLSS
eukprot:GSMAST32.ASY1.ANO1.2469.1 assembled CDS